MSDLQQPRHISTLPRLGGLLAGAAILWLLRPRTIELFKCIWSSPGREGGSRLTGACSGDAWPGHDPGWPPVRCRKCDRISRMLHCSALTRGQGGHSLPRPRRSLRA